MGINYLQCNECGGVQFFMRKQNGDIHAICVQCRDDTKLNDTLEKEDALCEGGENGK